MPQDGIEKRRRGPVNALRRALYGLLVSSASLPALALADPLAPAPAQRRLPVAHTSAPLRLDREVLLARDPRVPGADLLAYGGLTPLLAHAGNISSDFVFVPVGELLFTAHFLGTDLEQARKGLGVDLMVPELGYFHLNLYNGKDGPNGGKRWRINPQGFALPESANGLWSLGGSFALERDQPGGHRHLIFVPQLTLNLAGAAHLSGRLEALISYQNWRSPTLGHVADTGAVPQMSLNWSF